MEQTITFYTSGKSSPNGKKRQRSSVGQNEFSYKKDEKDFNSLMDVSFNNSCDYGEEKIKFISIRLNIFPNNPIEAIIYDDYQDYGLIKTLVESKYPKSEIYRRLKEIVWTLFSQTISFEKYLKAIYEGGITEGRKQKTKELQNVLAKKQYDYIVKYYPYSVAHREEDGKFFIKVWVMEDAKAIEEYLNKKSFFK